jgi:hypothetical protein
MPEGLRKQPRAWVEAPGIEPSDQHRQKPSRSAYLTNNLPIIRRICGPSLSTQFRRNSSVAAESRTYGAHEIRAWRGLGAGSLTGRRLFSARGTSGGEVALMDSHSMTIIWPWQSSARTASTSSSQTMS